MMCTDEYKEHYYAKRPGIKKRDYGDTSERMELRNKLQCKSFDWFLKHVYPELPLPNENLWHGGAVSFSLSLFALLLSLRLRIRRVRIKNACNVAKKMDSIYPHDVAHAMCCMRCIASLLLTASLTGVLLICSAPQSSFSTLS